MYKCSDFIQCKLLGMIQRPNYPSFTLMSLLHKDIFYQPTAHDKDLCKTRSCIQCHRTIYSCSICHSQPLGSLAIVAY